MVFVTVALETSGFEVWDFEVWGFEAWGFTDSGFNRVVRFAVVVEALVAAGFVLATLVDRLFTVAVFWVGFPFMTYSPFRELLSRNTNEDLPISPRKYPQPLGEVADHTISQDLRANNVNNFAPRFGLDLDGTIEKNPRHSTAMLRVFRLRPVQR